MASVRDGRKIVRSVLPYLSVFPLPFNELHKETKQNTKPKLCALSFKKIFRSICLTVSELQCHYSVQNVAGESQVTFTKMRCGT